MSCNHSQMCTTFHGWQPCKSWVRISCRTRVAATRTVGKEGGLENYLEIEEVPLLVNRIALLFLLRFAWICNGYLPDTLLYRVCEFPLAECSGLLFLKANSCRCLVLAFRPSLATDSQATACPIGFPFALLVSSTGLLSNDLDWEAVNLQVF